MKMDIKEELKNLKAEEARLEKDLKRVQKNRIAFEEKNFMHCYNGESCYDKFDFKKNSIVECKKFKSCGKTFPKDEFKFIIVEDYRVRQTSSDAGYGDCDNFSWVHEFTMYSVCPNCKSLTHEDYVETDRKGCWCRMEWDKEEIEKIKSEFVPKDWTDRKVIFVGSKKDCKKKFNALKKI